MRPRIGDKVLVVLSEQVLKDADDSTLSKLHGTLGCLVDKSGTSRYPFLVKFENGSQEFFDESELIPVSTTSCDWEL